MKRSEINTIVQDAERFFADMHFALPPWAHWDPDQWRGRSDVTEIVENSLGWDITDFGSSEFARRGLVLFTLRNGKPGGKERPAGKPYAEKIMIVGVDQETPWHFHWSKMEDIINRGGGLLVLELSLSDPETEGRASGSFTVQTDGITRSCRSGDRIALQPGESITLEQRLYHRFWAEGQRCLVGEVSKVNDDATDNRFLEPAARFLELVEDERPYRLLVTDYAAWVPGP